jgi:hypothetical protein
LSTEYCEASDDSNHDAETGRNTNCQHHYIVDKSEVRGGFAGWELHLLFVGDEENMKHSMH